MGRGNWNNFGGGTFAPGATQMSGDWDPKTGAFRGTVSQGAPRQTGESPFGRVFSDSVNQMSGLGGMLGGAFGTANMMNLATNEKAKDRMMISNLLSQIFGSNRGGGGSGFPVYQDASTRMTTGGMRTGGWQQR